jgi:hypothetical protein
VQHGGGGDDGRLQHVPELWGLEVRIDLEDTGAVVARWS